jgi:hypothetical protein
MVQFQDQLPFSFHALLIFGRLSGGGGIRIGSMRGASMVSDGRRRMKDHAEPGLPHAAGESGRIDAPEM